MVPNFDKLGVDGRLVVGDESIEIMPSRSRNKQLDCCTLFSCISACIKQSGALLEGSPRERDRLIEKAVRGRGADEQKSTTKRPTNRRRYETERQKHSWSLCKQISLPDMMGLTQSNNSGESRQRHLPSLLLASTSPAGTSSLAA